MAMKVQLRSLSKGSLLMLDYIERKQFIADSLAENLHPLSEEDLIGYILSSLDSSYAAFTTAFMMESMLMIWLVSLSKKRLDLNMSTIAMSQDSP